MIYNALWYDFKFFTNSYSKDPYNRSKTFESTFFYAAITQH